MTAKKTGDACAGCSERARLSAWTPLLPYAAITTGNTHKRLCGACGAVEYADLERISR